MLHRIHLDTWKKSRGFRLDRPMVSPGKKYFDLDAWTDAANPDRTGSAFKSLFFAAVPSMVFYSSSRDFQSRTVIE
jgi:hypothetical protein